MTLETQNVQKSELIIQREIRYAEDNLVLWIQDNMDEFVAHAEKKRQQTNDWKERKDYGKLEESQFRNVMSVADATDSPEVIKNFLLYQMGRDYKWGKGKDALAQKLIDDIGSKGSDSRLYSLAATIAEQAESSDVKKIWMGLIRRYLGFGSRYLVYLNRR